MPINNRFSFVTNERWGGSETGTKTPTITKKPVNGSLNNSNIEEETETKTPTSTISKPTYSDQYLKEYLAQIQASKDKQTNALEELRAQLKENSYLDLMKSNIAMANAKDAALRYTDNYMRAMGYGSQGMTSTNQVQNRNAYLNALQENRAVNSQANAEIDQAYQESLMGIQREYDSNYLNYLSTLSDREYNTYLAELQNYYNQQQQQAQWDREDQQTSDLEDTVAGEDWFNTVYQLASQYTTKEELKEYLDSLGNWQEGMTPTQIKQINALYNSKELEEDVDKGTSSDINWDTPHENFPTQNHNTMPYYYENGERKTVWKDYTPWFDNNMGSMFGTEYNELLNLAADSIMSELQGIAVKLTNNKGQYIYCMYDDSGTLRLINDAEYRASKKKGEIRGNTLSGALKDL